MTDTKPTLEEQIAAVINEADVVATACVAGADEPLRAAAESLVKFAALIQREMEADNAELRKDGKRADSWVAEVRRVARELGLPDDDSNGSIEDWKLICRKLGVKTGDEAAIDRARSANDT